MGVIVDQFNQPIQTETLTEEQSEQSATRQLHREFENHPSRGLTPSKLAGILQSAENGDLVQQADLGQDMIEKDGHIFAELQKRGRAVSGLPWDILPPRNANAAEIHATELVKEMLVDMNKMDDIVVDMSAALGYAYSNQEIKWQRIGKEWMPETIEYRDANWFQMDQETRTELLLRNNTGLGEPLQPFGWIAHQHKAKSGHLARGGLLRILAWPYLFKNYSVRDLAEFLEIYGLPMRLGKYPAGTDKEGKMKLLQAVVGIGHNAAGVIPQGMEIDFQAAADGHKDPFEFMISWCENTQSKIILGGTLTSQSTGGTNTNALGNVHNECRKELRDSDAIQYAATLTRDLCYPMAVLNAVGIAIGRGPRFKFHTDDAEDIAVYSEALPKLVGIGMNVSEKWAQTKLGIPIPEENERVLQVAQPEQATPPTTPPVQTSDTLRALIKGHFAALSNTAMPKKDVADNYSQQLSQVAPAALDPMFQPIIDLLNNAETMEDLRTELEALYPNMDDSELTAQIEEALVASDLAGRYEVIK